MNPYFCGDKKSYKCKRENNILVTDVRIPVVKRTVLFRKIPS